MDNYKIGKVLGVTINPINLRRMAHLDQLWKLQIS